VGLLPAGLLFTGGERHWVPDPATLTSKWSWAQVQTLPDAQVTAVPLGNPIPSVIDPGTWPNGALIIAPPAPQVYVMEGGTAHWVPDPPTLFANGYDWSAVETIPGSVMGAIPTGQPIPSVLNTAAQIVVDTGNDSLGAGHFMATRAEFTRATGLVQGTTRTFTTTDLGGFHGSVTTILADANQIAVSGGQNPQYRYGVDGRWIGQSDRTDAWPTASQPFSIPVAITTAVVSLNILHAWDPDTFQTILDKWVAAGASVAQLAKDAGSVASLFSGTGK
jgi:hypothetical protein